jgi:hypothetical protein
MDDNWWTRLDELREEARHAYFKQALRGDEQTSISRERLHVIESVRRELMPYAPVKENLV